MAPTPSIRSLLTRKPLQAIRLALASPNMDTNLVRLMVQGAFVEDSH